MRFSEMFACPYIIAATDHAAGIVGDSINMGKVHHAAFFLQLGALTGDAILTMNSGAAVATKTTALTFNYRPAGADMGVASADVYGAWATSAALTLTAATYNDRCLIVEVDASEMTDDEPYLTMDISSAASVALASCVAICYTRFHGLTNPTVLT